MAREKCLRSLALMFSVTNTTLESPRHPEIRVRATHRNTVSAVTIKDKRHPNTFQPCPKPFPHLERIFRAPRSVLLPVSRRPLPPPARSAALPRPLFFCGLLPVHEGRAKRMKATFNTGTTLVPNTLCSCECIGEQHTFMVASVTVQTFRGTS